jgi:hypothetical protein
MLRMITATVVAVPCDKTTKNKNSASENYRGDEEFFWDHIDTPALVCYFLFCFVLLLDCHKRVGGIILCKKRVIRFWCTGNARFLTGFLLRVFHISFFSFYGIVMGLFFCSFFLVPNAVMLYFFPSYTTRSDFLVRRDRTKESGITTQNYGSSSIDSSDQTRGHTRS